MYSSLGSYSGGSCKTVVHYQTQAIDLESYFLYSVYLYKFTVCFAETVTELEWVSKFLKVNLDSEINNTFYLSYSNIVKELHVW